MANIIVAEDALKILLQDLFKSATILGTLEGAEVQEWSDAVRWAVLQDACSPECVERRVNVNIEYIKSLAEPSEETPVEEDMDYVY